MKSIGNLVSEAIESFREKVAIWDNPDASLTEKAEVVKFVLINNSEFCQEVAKWATAKPVKRVKAISPLEVVKMAEEPSKPTTIVLVSPAPKPVVPTKPAAPTPATVAPRTLSLSVGGNVFAAKLNGVAAEMHLGGDKSPLGRFRELMLREDLDDDGWLECRKATTTVLSEKLLREESDWKLLIDKIKRDRFFLDPRSSGMFLSQCPKELVADLLLAEDGLWNLVEEIRAEQKASDTSPYRISFVIDACVVVGGKEAYGLLTKSKDAVNRMKMRNLILADHWLIQKVAAMKQPRLARPTATLVEVPSEVPTPTTTKAKLDDVQQIAEVAVAAEEAVVAPMLVLEGDKPVLDPKFEREFAEMMLAESASTSVN